MIPLSAIFDSVTLMGILRKAIVDNSMVFIDIVLIGPAVVIVGIATSSRRKRGFKELYNDISAVVPQVKLE